MSHLHDVPAVPTAPVLFLQPTRDRIVSDRLSRQLRQALPRVKVQRIDGPHLLLQSRPAQCAAAITGFLADQETEAIYRRLPYCASGRRVSAALTDQTAGMVAEALHAVPAIRVRVRVR